MVKTNRLTLYNIQQSATQGSNDTTHTLSRRTAATTRCSPESIDCQKQTAPSYPTCQQSDHVGLYLTNIHQMAPPKRGRTHLIIALLLIYDLSTPKG